MRRERGGGVPAADGLGRGLDLESDPWAREMARRYFQPGVRQLDAAACREDPYYAAVRLPQARRGPLDAGV